MLWRILLCDFTLAKYSRKQEHCHINRSVIITFRGETIGIIMFERKPYTIILRTHKLFTL